MERLRAHLGISCIVLGVVLIVVAALLDPGGTWQRAGEGDSGRRPDRRHLPRVPTRAGPTDSGGALGGHSEFSAWRASVRTGRCWLGHHVHDGPNRGEGRQPRASRNPVAGSQGPWFHRANRARGVAVCARVHQRGGGAGRRPVLGASRLSPLSLSVFVAAYPPYLPEAQLVGDLASAIPTRAGRLRPHYWHCDPFNRSMEKTVSQPWFRVVQPAGGPTHAAGPPPPRGGAPEAHEPCRT